MTLATRPWPRCTNAGCRGYAAKSGICPPCRIKGTSKRKERMRNLYAARGQFWTTTHA